MFAFEQKCQAKGQKLKLDNIKEWKIVSLLSLDKIKQYALVHSIAVKLYDRNFFICLSKFSWKSISIPSNFTTWSHDILEDSVLKTGSFA